MISNSQIQAAWVAKLKSNIPITAVTSDIRENQWKGTSFNYPCIRVKLNSLKPSTQNSNCLIFISDVSILCFVELKSSKTADELAGVISTQFWGHPFTAGGVKFTAINLTEVVPAYTPEWDTNSWLAEVQFSCLVQSA